jgi:hypothetical protein
VKPAIRRAVLAALCALSVSGCIDSAKPLLSDSKALFGPQLHLQFFSLRKGFAHDPEQARYVWNGTHYVHADGGMSDIGAFSVHPFEGGDYILQSMPGKSGQPTEYAVLHTLTGGVYQVIPVDEDDADAATRAAHCRHVDKSYCRIATRDELLAFARATAARHKTVGGLAIRLPDVAQRRDRKP